MFSGRVAWNDCLGAHIGDEGAKGIGIVGFVGKDAAGREALEQGRGERGIAALAGREDALERSAEPVHGHVDRGCQPSSGAPQSLVPPFLTAPPFRWQPADEPARGLNRD